MSHKEITSLNDSILDELHIEELEEKFELAVLPALDALVERADMVGVGVAADCTVQCSGNCTSQCGSQCYSNSSRFLAEREVADPSPVLSRTTSP